MNKILKLEKNKSHKLCFPDICHKTITEGLSVTPAQMDNMSRSGIPISSQNASSFIDGDGSFDPELLPEYRRGIDAIDAWELQQSSKKRILQANKKDIENYGK